MIACQARTQSDGSHHCAACRLAWDRDDEAPPCPRVESPSIVPGFEKNWSKAVIFAGYTLANVGLIVAL